MILEDRRAYHMRFVINVDFIGWDCCVEIDQQLYLGA